MDPGDRLAAQGSWLALLVRHLAGRRVRAAADPDDLVQEVYLRALDPRARPPSESEGEAALKAWLARLARNVVVDVARALRAARRAGRTVPLARSDWSSVGPDGVRPASPGPGPATRAGRNDEGRRLLRAFDALGPEHRRVIGLRQLEGLSAADTARRMGRSETAVHSLYRRALQAWAEAERRGTGPDS